MAPMWGLAGNALRVGRVTWPRCSPGYTRIPRVRDAFTRIVVVHSVPPRASFAFHVRAASEPQRRSCHSVPHDIPYSQMRAQL